MLVRVTHMFSRCLRALSISVLLQSLAASLNTRPVVYTQQLLDYPALTKCLRQQAEYYDKVRLTCCFEMLRLLHPRFDDLLTILVRVDFLLPGVL